MDKVKKQWFCPWMLNNGWWTLDIFEFINNWTSLSKEKEKERKSETVREKANRHDIAWHNFCSPEHRVQHNVWLFSLFSTILFWDDNAPLAVGIRIVCPCNGYCHTFCAHFERIAFIFGFLFISVVGILLNILFFSFFPSRWTFSIYFSHTQHARAHCTAEDWIQVVGWIVWFSRESDEIKQDIYLNEFDLLMIWFIRDTQRAITMAIECRETSEIFFI